MMAFSMSQLEILAVLLWAIALAHWAGSKPVGRWFGSALLVIMVTAVCANIGIIPAASSGVALYDHLLGVAAPVSIFLLLLNVRLDSLRRVGLPMLLMFLLATSATVAGVLLAGWLTGAEQWMGRWYGPLSGMFAATYIGGGVNFNALALHYEVMQSGNLYAAVTVADNIITVIWISLLLLLPQWLGRWLPSSGLQSGAQSGQTPAATAESAPLGLHDLVILLALGIGAFVLTQLLAQWLATLIGINIPSILLLTTLALLLAQVPALQRLRGGQRLGMFGAYLFLAALGTLCEVSALRETGWLGIRLLCFVALVVGIHGLLLTLAGRCLRQSAEVIAVVSASTVGGATVVLPLVERFRRPDLLLPGIVLGSIGNALGTYVGFVLVYYLAA